MTGPTGWDDGSWVAAFLVLVTGVAQIGIGAGQAHLAPVAPSVTFIRRECAVWNLSCAAVIAGTLLSSPATVSIGSLFLLAGLGMATFAVRGTASEHPLLLPYRALLILLLASTPVGIALSWVRQ